jgi:hypothetical protein
MNQLITDTHVKFGADANCRQYLSFVAESQHEPRTAGESYVAPSLLSRVGNARLVEYEAVKTVHSCSSAVLHDKISRRIPSQSALGTYQLPGHHVASPRCSGTFSRDMFDTKRDIYD